MKRRDFLRNSSAVAAGTLLAPYIAKGEKIFDFKPINQIQSLGNDNIMIILELFGGNDGLNTIIPAYNPDYFNLRPKLAYPENRAKRFQSTDVYLNPSLVDKIYNGGLMKLLEDGRLAIIEGIGYEKPNLSHFRSEDIWLSGINSSDPNVRLLEGWLGRYFASKLPNYPLEIPDEPLCIAVDGVLPLMFKSNKGDMGIAFDDPQSFYELGKGLTPQETFLLENSAFANEFNFSIVTAKQAELYSNAVKKAYDSGKTKVGNFYSSGLSQKFRLIASLIAGGLKTKVYFVKLSNFDSHAQQMNDTFEGQHPTLLAQIASAISEFVDDSIKLGFADRVAGMTISEFGRRAKENGSRGTDHGAASIQFVFGAKVNGGYIGEKPKLAEKDLDADGNIKYQFDYRRTFVDFLETWFEGTKNDTVSVFNEPLMPIGVLKQKPVRVDEYFPSMQNNGLKIFPNPSLNGQALLSFELKKDAFLDISVLNNLGYQIKQVSSEFAFAGFHNIPFTIDISGNYIISVTANGTRITSGFIVNK